MLPRSAKWLLLTLATLTLASDQSTSDSAHTSTQRQGINWAPCPHPGRVQLECATLAVPLNYTAGASSETIDLQLTKVNALKQPSKGSILFNPGGPGRTGRDMIRGGNFGFAALLMTGGEHDLVAFNPRGTGDTIPFSCDLDMDKSDLNLDGPIWTSATPDSDSGWDELNRGTAQCSKTMGADGKLLGTTFVARDMMQIVDALGEDGMLRYWGMSYGTVLGATVAAMYPDRMDKIVLDGVVNLAEYWVGEPIESLIDSESVIDGFFINCVETPEYCELAADGSSAAELRQKLDTLVQAARVFPDGGVTFLNLIGSIADGIVSTSEWSTFASGLNAAFKLTFDTESDALSEVNQALSPPMASEGVAHPPLYGIRCSDSEFRAHDLSEVTQILEEIEAVAPTFAGTLASLVTVCGSWKMTAEERYTDPLQNIQTKNPILFIGNTHDPRTPLASARNASMVFPGSALLTLDGYGHCSTAHPSLCIGRAVRAYFADGTLPVEGAVCQPSIPAFHDPAIVNLETVEAHLWANGTADDDDALLAAWTHFGKEMSSAHGLL